MRCDELRNDAAAHGAGGLSEPMRQHLASCRGCETYVARMARLDRVVKSAVVVEPPAELRAQLAAMALAAARPSGANATAAKAARSPFALPSLDVLFGWLPRTRLAVAQMVALLSVSLASWQVYQWLGALTPVLGSPLYALELVAGSPALLYLSSLPINLAGVAQWSVVALLAWAVSERGPLHAYLRRAGLIP